MDDKVGWIYVMKSQDMPKERYKIGMTMREPDVRAKELSTSFSDDLKVLIKKKVSNRYEAEKRIFKILEEHMPSSKKELVDVFEFSVLENVFDYVADLYPLNKDDGIKIKIGRCSK